MKNYYLTIVKLPVESDVSRKWVSEGGDPDFLRDDISNERLD